MSAYRLLLSVVVAVIATLLSGCSKTNLTQLWKNPEAPPTPLGSVLVIALDREADLRRLWESSIAAEFQAHGVVARPSYQLFPASLPDSQQVVVTANRDGYDGVVVTHRLAPTATGSFDSDYARTGPAGHNDYWRGWYHTHYLAAMQDAPSKADDARYQIDVVGTTGGGKLAWTGSTTPIDPASEEKVRVEVCGELVSELVRQGIVAKRD
jgi:hypothetical protein